MCCLKTSVMGTTEALESGQRELHGLAVAACNFCCCLCLGTAASMPELMQLPSQAQAAAKAVGIPCHKPGTWLLCRHLSCSLGACLHTAASRQSAFVCSAQHWCRLPAAVCPAAGTL